MTACPSLPAFPPAAPPPGLDQLPAAVAAPPGIDPGL